MLTTFWYVFSQQGQKAFEKRQESYEKLQQKLDEKSREVEELKHRLVYKDLCSELCIVLYRS